MSKIGTNVLNVKTSYVDFIETLPWDFFITGSTRYELTLKSTRRLMERWFDMLKVEGAALFWVAEKFELKDGFHAHGLLNVPNVHGSVDPDGSVQFRNLIDLWQIATGNKAISIEAGQVQWDKAKWNALNLQRYDKRRGAGGYCAKYIMKDGCDYDLLC